MFMVDVETLGKKTDSILLSLACVHFNPDANPSPEEMVKSAFFVKFDAKDQVKRHNRKVSNKSTLEWWEKQCENAKRKSLYPSKDDVTLEEGFKQFREWAQKFDDYKTAWVWARGNLDQLIVDSIEDQLKIEPVFYFNRWRDVRTAIDFLTNSSNGYCDVNYENFNPEIHITKHDPVDDCIYDIMMLVYGKKS